MGSFLNGKKYEEKKEKKIIKKEEDEKKENNNSYHRSAYEIYRYESDPDSIYISFSLCIPNAGPSMLGIESVVRSAHRSRNFNYLFFPQIDHSSIFHMSNI